VSYWLVIMLVAFPTNETLRTIGPMKFASQQECEAARDKISGKFVDFYHTIEMIGECHPDKE
jgi:hypothetical protein